MKRVTLLMDFKNEVGLGEEGRVKKTGKNVFFFHSLGLLYDGVTEHSDLLKDG